MSTKDRQKLRVPADVQIIADNDILEVFWDKLGSDNAETGLELQVKVPPGLPLGHYNSQVVVRDTRTGEDVSIPVVWQSIGSLTVAPSLLFFRKQSVGKKGDESETFLVRATGGQALGEARVSAPPGLTVREISAISDSIRRFEVRRDPNDRRAVNGFISVSFDGSEDSVQLRLLER